MCKVRTHREAVVISYCLEGAEVSGGVAKAAAGRSKNGRPVSKRTHIVGQICERDERGLRVAGRFKLHHTMTVLANQGCRGHCSSANEQVTEKEN